jgi:hypothetical protein
MHAAPQSEKQSFRLAGTSMSLPTAGKAGPKPLRHSPNLPVGRPQQNLARLIEVIMEAHTDAVPNVEMASRIGEISKEENDPAMTQKGRTPIMSYFLVGAFSAGPMECRRTVTSLDIAAHVSNAECIPHSVRAGRNPQTGIPGGNRMAGIIEGAAQADGAGVLDVGRIHFAADHPLHSIEGVARIVLPQAGEGRQHLPGNDGGAGQHRGCRIWAEVIGGCPMPVGQAAPTIADLHDFNPTSAAQRPDNWELHPRPRTLVLSQQTRARRTQGKALTCRGSVSSCHEPFHFRGEEVTSIVHRQPKASLEPLHPPDRGKIARRAAASHCAINRSFSAATGTGRHASSDAGYAGYAGIGHRIICSIGSRLGCRAPATVVSLPLGFLAAIADGAGMTFRRNPPAPPPTFPQQQAAVYSLSNKSQSHVPHS